MGNQRYVERDGVKVAYEVGGDGPPILLGHSLLCDGRMWDPVLPALQARHRVINVDARGHRHSTVAGRYALEDLADDWVAILDQEGIERAVLVGLSMGGMTAMRVALRAPHRVAGLALLDTSAGPQPGGQRAQFRIMAEMARFLGSLKPFKGPIRKNFFSRTTLRERRDVADAQLYKILENPPRQTYRALRAVIDRRSILGEIGAISVPTLVMVGEEDAATPPRQSEEIAEAIPGAILVTIPRTGHLCSIESPEAVTGELVPFLAGIEW